MLLDELECTLCLVESRLRQIARTGLTQEKVRKFFSFLSSLDLRNRTLAFAKSYEFVLTLNDGEDIYRDQKQKIRDRFLTMLRQVQSQPLNIWRAIRWAVNANLLDVEMPTYRPDIEQIVTKLDSEVHIRACRDIVQLIEESQNVYYALDNVGEHLFDLLFVKLLVEQGKSVTLLVRGRPYEIDVTYDMLVKDLELMNLHGTVQVIVRDDFMPPLLSLSEMSTSSGTVVISKGIANLEAYLNYADKLEKFNIVFLLTAKCAPLARFFSVPQGSGIVVDSYFLNQLIRDKFSRDVT